MINNAHVPGYDTGLELLLYRQLKGLGCPDLVLIGLYGNDIWENGSPSQGPYAKPYFRLMDGQLHWPMYRFRQVMNGMADDQKPKMGGSPG